MKRGPTVRIAGLTASIPGAVLAVIGVIAADAQSREKRVTPVDPAQRESFSKATNVAVVVGVSDYAPDTGLQKLQFADRDAQAIAAELRRQNYTVRVLVNSEATRSRIVSAVREAGDVVTRDGTLLFFFSGHGFAPQPGRNYLATFGVTLDELAQDGLSVDDLRQRVQQSPARRKVLFLDACRSEAGKGGGARSFASLAASSGLRMLLSTQMGKISYENDQLQQGVFTYFLLKALRGEAAGADGFVTFRDVSEYVSSSVRQWSFERSQTQVPVELSDEAAGDFLLARASAPLTPRESAAPAPAPVKVAPPIPGPDNSRTNTSQPATVAIEGDVIGSDGRPLAGATIAIVRQDIRANYQAKTDRKGHFFYGGLPLGRYQVSVLVNNVSASSLDVRTTLGNTTQANFNLSQVSSPDAGPDAAARAQLQRNKELNDTLNAGMAAAGAKNYGAAIDSFRRAAELDPNQHVVWAHLGEAYLGLNQPSEAIAAYARAVAIKPDDAAYHNNYALALARGNRFDQARAEIESAARLDPAGGAKYFFNLGAILVNSGHSDQAEAAFRRSTEVDPNYADAHYQLGICLMARATVNAAGRVVPPAGTREAFESYLRLAPSGPNAGPARSMLQSIGAK